MKDEGKTETELEWANKAKNKPFPSGQRSK